MDQLTGRTAVVTGGASGIGRAIADRFAREGMNVVVSDVDDAAVRSAVADLEQAGHRVLGVRTDVSRAEDIQALADATIDAFGTVNIVVNNAGVVIGGRVEELTEEEWRWVLDVDLWGAIRGVRVFLPLIEASGEGHIVSTASTSGMAAPPFIGPYAVSKAGVVALMETVRRELDARASPIGASVLIPGPVKTSLVTSPHNRPDDLRNRSETAEGRAFAEDSGTYLATIGIEPADVAALLVEAVRVNRFWVLTHPEWVGVLRARVESIATTRRLADRPGP